MNPALMMLMRAKKAVTIADTFTRANSALTLGNTETGQAWTAAVGTWGITSNRAYRVSASAGRPTAVANLGVTNMRIKATISTRDGGDYPAVVGRWVDVDNTYQMGVSGGAGSTISASRRQGAVTTMLGTPVPVPATPFTIELSLTDQPGGTLVTAWVNGTVIYTELDTTSGRPNGTRAGIMRIGGTVSTDTTFDDFSAIGA